MLSERELAFIARNKDHYPRVYGFVQRRVNDHELAQELAADVFRVVWQKQETTAGAELPWLLTIARNLIGNAYRSRDRQLALQDKLKQDVRTRFRADEVHTPVHEAMDALRDKDRDVLQLAYWDALTTAEIAAVLGCSESTAKVRLHRARTSFRRHLPSITESATQKMGA